MEPYVRIESKTKPLFSNLRDKLLSRYFEGDWFALYSFRIHLLVVKVTFGTRVRNISIIVFIGFKQGDLGFQDARENQIYVRRINCQNHREWQAC